jgi:hypothetical protein
MNSLKKIGILTPILLSSFYAPNSAISEESQINRKPDIEFGCTVFYANGDKAVYKGTRIQPSVNKTLVTFTSDSPRYRSFTKETAYFGKDEGFHLQLITRKEDYLTHITRYDFYLNENAYAHNGYVIISITSEKRPTVTGPWATVGTGICQITKILKDVM